MDANKYKMHPALTLMYFNVNSSLTNVTPGPAKLWSEQHPHYLHEGFGEWGGGVGSWVERAPLPGRLEEHPVGLWAVREVRGGRHKHIYKQGAVCYTKHNCNPSENLNSHFLHFFTYILLGRRNPNLVSMNQSFVPCKHWETKSSPYLKKCWNRPGIKDI